MAPFLNALMAKLPKYHHRAVFYDMPPDGRYPEEKGEGFTKCLHKRPHAESLYLLSNEVICAGLGRILGLPIPSWEVTVSADGTEWFSSLHFNFDNDQLPDVDPQAFWDEKPNWLTAVVVFDIFIANADRHDENIVVDHPIKPTVMKIFDHDQALFGGLTDHAHGVERLRQSRDALGITSATGGSRNDFVREMTTDKYVMRWVRKIQDIKNWMIDTCVDAAAKYNICANGQEEVKSFLRHRRDRLHSIILDNKEHFVNIDDMRLGGLF